MRLDVANQRAEQNRAALAQHQTVAQASEARHEAGMANQLDVEEVRRMAWGAEDTMLGSQRDSALAWIALYKALGGGWQDDVAMAEGKR